MLTRVANPGVLQGLYLPAAYVNLIVHVTVYNVSIIACHADLITVIGPCPEWGHRKA